jgi:hypothetical protein
LLKVPPGAQAFTLHNKSGFGDKILLIGLAALFEIVPVHIFVRQRSHPGSWVLFAVWAFSALSLCGAIWLLDLSRSLNLRPCLVEPGQATIRLGKLFSLTIPARCIANITTDPGSDAFVLPPRAGPNLRIDFTEPLAAERAFGPPRRLTAIALAADDPGAFAAALRLMAY